MKTRPKVAIAFLAFGLLAGLALAVISMIGDAFANWGDGAAYGNTEHTSPTLPLVFFAFYFVAGIAAALTTQRPGRLMALAFAHLVPLFPFPLLTGDDARAFFTFYALTYVLGSPLWLQLLSIEKQRIPP